MQAANERSMKMAENQMKQMKEAMMAIIQWKSAPTLAHPVHPPPTVWTPPAREQYITPPVNPIPYEQMVDESGVTWHVYKHCKGMCTHAEDDCWELENNEGKHKQLIKKQQTYNETKGKHSAAPEERWGRRYYDERDSWKVATKTRTKMAKIDSNISLAQSETNRNY